MPAIVDALATKTPPAYHVHAMTTGDTVDELNDWAIALFSPEYSVSRPAFEQAGDGVHYFDGVGFNGLAVPIGWYVIIDPMGSITVLAPDDFARQFTPSA